MEASYNAGQEHLEKELSNAKSYSSREKLLFLLTESQLQSRESR